MIEKTLRLGFLVINVCKHGEHYETPRITAIHNGMAPIETWQFLIIVVVHLRLLVMSVKFWYSLESLSRTKTSLFKRNTAKKK